MSRVIRPPEPRVVETSEFAVFLAGSIEMGVADDWQAKVTAALRDAPRLVLLNPRRADWDASWTQNSDTERFREQVKWELAGMEDADLVAIYFDPSTKSPVTLLELGLCASQDNPKAIVCCPTGFWRKGNVDIVCDRYGVRTVHTLDELVEAIRQVSERNDRTTGCTELERLRTDLLQCQRALQQANQEQQQQIIENGDLRAEVVVLKQRIAGFEEILDIRQLLAGDVFLRELDPVCPTCRMPLGKISSVLAGRDADREEIAELKREVERLESDLTWLCGSVSDALRGYLDHAPVGPQVEYARALLCEALYMNRRDPEGPCATCGREQDNKDAWINGIEGPRCPECNTKYNQRRRDAREEEDEQAISDEVKPLVAKIKQIECSYCGAERGARCISRSGDIYSWRDSHMARWYAARVELLAEEGK